MMANPGSVPQRLGGVGGFAGAEFEVVGTASPVEVEGRQAGDEMFGEGMVDFLEADEDALGELIGAEVVVMSSVLGCK